MAYDLNQKIFMNFSNQVELLIISYCFLAVNYNIKYILFKPVFNKNFVYSLVNLYYNLNWAEREASEMHNIKFTEKTDSRHLLLDYSYFGNPLKKNYSIFGYVEIVYNFLIAFIEYTFVEKNQLNQIIRIFDF